MKKIVIVIALTASMGAAKAQQQEVELKTMLDSAMYVIGNQIGENFFQSFFINQIEVNTDAFFAGFKDAYGGGSVKVQDPQKTEVMNAFNELVQQKQQEKAEREASFNKLVAESIMSQNREKEEIKETESGLQYEVLKEGNGVRPTMTDNVEVHYVGTLYNGTTFDSSRDRGQPFTFSLTQQFIKGWSEGILLMSEGSTYKFWIPAELGYGNQAMGTIPAGSLLIFEV
ncbi:MAG: FKBP-type peptidyl-prolyl cis-trans isomerase, partial [Lentimicrobiaceae bacterium]|nr:FKBP-type peptidyl-prolyl cis-trans isomerase [Lentimicrobiaceae bacterium]